jgi:hypothetical protein
MQEYLGRECLIDRAFQGVIKPQNGFGGTLN